MDEGWVGGGIVVSVIVIISLRSSDATIPHTTAITILIDIILIFGKKIRIIDKIVLITSK